MKHANSRSLVELTWYWSELLIRLLFLRGVVPLPPQLGVPCQPGGWHLFAGQPVDRLELALDTASSLHEHYATPKKVCSNEIMSCIGETCWCLWTRPVNQISSSAYCTWTYSRTWSNDGEVPLVTIDDTAKWRCSRRDRSKKRLSTINRTCSKERGKSWQLNLKAI